MMKKDVDGRDKPGHDENGWSSVAPTPGCRMLQLRLGDQLPGRAVPPRTELELKRNAATFQC
jgi:hypothetical protein